MQAQRSSCPRWPTGVAWWFVLSCMALYGQDKRATLKGLVFEAEDWSTPTTAWVKDQHPADKWCLWTQEEDVRAKRSGGQSLQSPRIGADRQSPEEGAPPLHTHITGIPAAVYQVWMNAPARPIALSFDGVSWQRFASPGEIDLGLRRVTDGTFDLWVDDRYANPGALGSCYYDYLRFVEFTPPTFAQLSAFTLPDGATQISWITDRPVPTGEVWYGRPGAAESCVRSAANGNRNHAVSIQGLVPGLTYWAQVRVSVAGASVFQSEALEFTAGYRPSPTPTVPQRLRLEVREPTAMGRAAWPVTSGIPFAQGVLASAADVRLVGAQGQPLPAQFEATARWPDGSVRWLLVDFIAATRPGTPAVYWLETGTAWPQANEPLVARREGDNWVLDTGCLRVPVGPGTFTPFSSVKTDLNGDGIVGPEESGTAEAPDGTAWLVDDGGRRFVAGPATVVEVETQGPLRACIRVEGDFVGPAGETLCRYRGRLTAWRGLGLLRLQWTIGNNRVSSPFTTLTSAALRLPLAGQGATLAAFEGQPLAPLPSAGPVQLLQDYDDHFACLRGGTAEEGQRATGWVRVQRGNVDVSVMVRDFWQTYPKGLEVTADSVLLHLLPALPASQYSRPADQSEVASIMKYYAYAEGKYLIKAGLEWTADVMLKIGPAEAGGDSATAAHFQESLLAQAAPEVYCQSGAFWNLDPWRPDEFPTYQEAFNTSFANLEKGRRERGEYGWMNYGDWWGERSWNWGNSEYDLSYVLALNFAQTGRLDVFWRGDQMARHNTTIDVVHYPWTEPFRERVYAHSVGHVGGFFSPDDPRIQNRVWSMKGFIAGARDGSGGHTFAGGNFLYGFLTGDRRYGEVAEAVCWNQATTYTPAWNFGIERACGWSLYNAMSAYESTLNPFYLNAVRIYLEKVYELQDPVTGGWRMPQGPPECECPDTPHIGGKAFAAGVLLHGLAMVDRVMPEARLRASFVRGVDWLLDVSWNEEKGGFRYKTGCPKFLGSGWYTTLVTDSIAYAYELTHTERYRDFLLRTLPKPLAKPTGSGPSSGKDFASNFRHLPHTLYYVKRWGVSVLPEPPASLRVHVRGRVFVDAAGGGALSVVVRNPRAQAAPCALEIEALPGGVHVDARQVSWVAAPGVHAAPPIRLTVSRLTGEPVRLAVTAGEAPPQSATVALIRPTMPVAVGSGLGFVGPADHPSLQALRAVGAEATVISDLAAADLGAFKAIVVGADVLGVRSLNVPDSAAALAGFVQAGGRLAWLQINDQDWPLDLLPFDLLAQDDNGTAGAIVLSSHPLFAGVATIQPALCYDTIAYAAPAWTVLARDGGGRPAILTASFGQGQILVVEPSFDRWAGASPVDVGLPETVCRQLMANLVHWCTTP